jgi:hypothetical protein
MYILIFHIPKESGFYSYSKLKLSYRISDCLFSKSSGSAGNYGFTRAGGNEVPVINFNGYYLGRNSDDLSEFSQLLKKM